MQVIKDKTIIENTWAFIADDAEIKNGNISVSVARWKKDQNLLLKREGQLGIRIQPSDSIEVIAGDLDMFDLIELDFPTLADGRLFTHAWLLRERYAYQGEIRATGDYLADQVFYLSRVGVNAFAAEKQQDCSLILDNMHDFSVNYQSSIH